MLRTLCLTGSVRARDGIAVPLNALRLQTRDADMLLMCTELMQFVLVILKTEWYRSEDRWAKSPNVIATSGIEATKGVHAMRPSDALSASRREAEVEDESQWLQYCQVIKLVSSMHRFDIPCSPARQTP